MRGRKDEPSRRQAQASRRRDRVGTHSALEDGDAIVALVVEPAVVAALREAAAVQLCANESANKDSAESQ
jgi:hypothetical protein